MRWHCWRLRARLVDNADDVLSADERVLVEEHMAVCPRCAAQLAAMRDLASVLRGSKGPAREEDSWRRQSADIMRRIRGLPETGPRQRPARVLVWRPVLVAVVAVLVVVAVYEVLRSPARPRLDLAAALDGLDTQTMLAFVDAATNLVPETGLPLADTAANRDMLGSVAEQLRLTAGMLAEPPGASDLNDEELGELSEMVGDVLG